MEIEQPNPEQEERQRKLLSDFEKAQSSKKKKTWFNKWFGKKNKEWWEMYQEGENEKKSKESGALFDRSKKKKTATKLLNLTTHKNISSIYRTKNVFVFFSHTDFITNSKMKNLLQIIRDVSDLHCEEVFCS